MHNRPPIILAFILFAVIIAAMIFSLFNGTRLAEIHAPMQDAAMEIKLEAAIAHLWFEEIISGDRYEDISQVWSHLDQSAWYANAMLIGGENMEGKFIPLTDPVLRREVRDVIEKIKQFKAIAEQRWKTAGESGIGSAIDQRFDMLFQKLLNQSDRVETSLQNSMTKDLGQFKFIQRLLIAITFILSLIVGWLFLRYEKQRSLDVAEIKDNEQRLAAIADYTYDWEDWIDSEGKLMWLNPAVETITGYSIQDCQRMSDYPLPLVHADDRSSLSSLLKSALKDQSVIDSFEFRIRHRNNSVIWVSLSALSIFDSEGAYIGLRSSIRNITQKKEDQQKIKQLNEGLEQTVTERTRQLKQANKRLLELDRLKSMFIASMSHELRTPLNSIIGFSGMMVGDMVGKISEQQRDYLQRVNRAGKHLLDLITEVIDISKIEAGKLAVVYSDFSLDEVINEALDMIESSASQKGLKLITDVEAGIQMHSDQKRLYQCLLNFLSNAVKYSERGQIKLHVRQQDEEIKIRVTDTGIGISEKDLELLFQPFIRLDTPLKMHTSGTGLGLYLTHKLASEVLQGDVKVSSRDGEGSIFTLQIPRQVKVIEEVDKQEVA